MDEVSQLLEALEGIKRRGFDPATVVSQYRNFRERDAGKIAVEELRKEVNSLQEEVAAHRQVMREYEELKSMGFGLKELKQLANTIKEIANANKIFQSEAVQKFFADIEDQYDKKLGFELKLENLKSEIQKNELRRAAIQNQSYGIDWSSFGSLFSGVDTRKGQVKACDKFQRVDQAAAVDSKQQAKTKGANATGPGNVFQSLATNNNVAPSATAHGSIDNEADKEEQEEDELYKYSEQLQQHQQPNNGSKNNKNNSIPTNNIESAIQTLISNSLKERGANSSNFLNYENSKYGVKLQYPSDWVYREIGNSNPSNTSLSPQIIVIFTSLKSFQQQPIASVGIGVMNLPSRKITLDEFTKLNLNNLRQSNADFQLIGSDSTILFGGKQANELVYAVGGEKTRHCILYTIIADKVYIIQYEAQSEYPAYASSVQKLVNSIEFLSTTTTPTVDATSQTGWGST